MFFSFLFNMFWNHFVTQIRSYFFKKHKFKKKFYTQYSTLRNFFSPYERFVLEYICRTTIKTTQNIKTASVFVLNLNFWHKSDPCSGHNSKLRPPYTMCSGLVKRFSNHNTTTVNIKIYYILIYYILINLSNVCCCWTAWRVIWSQ